ncbi:oxygen-dependent coproporphyrinogen oxidase [Alkalihalobacillus sp. AL-G]|uniref:oxygen-dependent coproporphyrinogen oxidase n=1 Tax=Alkalihalobacillus sp. AL-G TaxID=2926399 RepID=UPI0027298D67|nr:oxygen-dependent coproporphyrinogen oxidase [Alkalihalobacillus sp. AL-G]WLD93281.1 oxygen-dependent coproporphyrinogen oxidase [Alkalihalobacillus sp. AL-G]
MGILKSVKPIDINRTYISDSFRNLQDEICTELEHCDGQGAFKEELWGRDEGGGGRTRILQNGNIIEKGGVNFSEVYGPLSDQIADGLKVSRGNDFFATGVSVIMHPISPMIPIIHMNVRYFEVSSGEKWFGGGIDLTPIYIDVNQTKQFHSNLKSICDRHHHSYYPAFKKWADDYFYIKHRNETRGVGGIFFDRLGSDDEITLEERFAFVEEIGKSFVPIYTSIINENRNLPYEDLEQTWQKVRRGRYVEFNLVYDKGTKFGLDSGGRIESIFMSLPPEVSWLYNYQPEPDSNEAITSSLLRKNIDWINF